MSVSKSSKPTQPQNQPTLHTSNSKMNLNVCQHNKALDSWVKLHSLPGAGSSRDSPPRGSFIANPVVLAHFGVIVPCEYFVKLSATDKINRREEGEKRKYGVDWWSFTDSVVGTSERESLLTQPPSIHLPSIVNDSLHQCPHDSLSASGPLPQ